MFEHWTPCEATVVARQVRTVQAGYEPNYDFVLDVRPPGAAPLRVTIHEGTFGPKGGFRSPEVGEVVGVLVDAKSGKVKFDNDDPRLSAEYAGRAATDAFLAATAAAPGTPAPAAGMTNPLAERLATLSALKEQGLLTDDEYQAQRQRILGTI